MFLFRQNINKVLSLPPLLTYKLYNMRFYTTKGILLLMALLTVSLGYSQTNDQVNYDSLYKDLPVIEVVRKSDRLFKDVPGAVNVITEKEINKIAPLNISDVMRKTPGINVVDEDPAGLRTNIGIRGLNPIRSSKVLVLEDGVPVTLNPYGEPALYFSPMIDIMNGVEVLKGSGQLEFGPQTIGGVVNFKTAAPPEEAESRIKLAGGRGGFVTGSFSHGNTVDRVGYFFNATHKRADNMGPMQFRLTNLMGKVNIRLSDKSELGLKLTALNETSNSTYLGITQAMYDNDDNLRTALAPDDLMLIRRISFSAVHNYRFSSNVKLQTTAYAYGIQRNWRRQQFTRNGANSNSNGVVWGDPNTTDGSAIFMSNRTDWRNRQYLVGGVESKLIIRHNLFGVNNVLKTGARFLRENATEQFIQGNKPDSWGGNMRDNEVRDGSAASVFAINRTEITKKFSAEYGVRLENYDYRRKIYRGRFTEEGTQVVKDTIVEFSRNTLAFLPGIGLNYNVNDNFSLFAGVHKGFAPPQIKSAITADGAVADIDKEESVNFELGGRFSHKDYLRINLTAFYTHFDNQVIPVNTAINPSGIASGGETQHSGIELDFHFDIARALGSQNSVSIGANATYLQARYQGDDVVDNFLPYAPVWMINTFIAADFVKGFGISLYGNYVSEQFNDQLNTVTPSADGTIGRIDARFIVDGSVYYSIPNTGLTLTISGKNLFNEKYIVSRNPQGIRVGLDRYITFGADFRF